METLPKNPLLDYHPDTLQNVRKLFGLEDPKRMVEAIDILQEWARKQEHFTVTEFDRDLLEKIIVINKGLLERSKSRLDRMCTLRTLMPEMFQVVNIKTDVTYSNTVSDIVLPKLTPDNYRIVITKNHGTAYGSNILMDYYMKQICFWQYLLRHDYNAGFIIIYDLTDADVMEIIKSTNMTEFKKFVTTIMEGYGARIKVVYTISNSKFMNILYDMAKSLVPAKIGNRLEILNDIEALKTKVPVDILPSDYGGKAKPFGELLEEVTNVLSSDDHIEFLKKMGEYKTDESKRQVDKFNENYMGMPGTFRTLNVD